jgi:hypothetical protein
MGARSHELYELDRSAELSGVFGREQQRAAEEDEMKKEAITIDISALFADGSDKPTAKLGHLPRYVRAAKEQAGHGRHVILTGPGPVWLYLIIAHELHGIARSLRYDSPVTGQIIVFDHNPE